MNREAMLAVADVIEYFDRLDMEWWINDPDQELFGSHTDMTRAWTDCGTTACVAGWTLAWADAADVSTDDDDWNRRRGVAARAQQELGLTQRQARRLFFSDIGAVNIWSEVRHEYDFDQGPWSYHPTASQAADVLRRIADGELKL